MIHRRLHWLWTTVFLGVSCHAGVIAAGSIDTYQTIVTRSPFKKFNTPTAVAAQPTDGNLTLTGFFFDTDVKKVWLRDSKTSKTHYVGEGDIVPDSEYRVDKIDAGNQTVTLSHGLENLMLAFPAKSPAPTQTTAIAGVPNPSLLTPDQLMAAGVIPRPLGIHLGLPPGVVPDRPGSSIPLGKMMHPRPPATISSQRRTISPVFGQNVAPMMGPSGLPPVSDPNNGGAVPPAEEAPPQP